MGKHNWSMQSGSNPLAPSFNAFFCGGDGGNDGEVMVMVVVMVR